MKAKDVVRLFERFEDDTEDDELTDSEKVKGIVMDLDDRKDRDLWKTMDGYDEREYMEFKGSVLEFYLGTKKTAAYLLEQLEDLIDDTRDQRMTLRRLSKYQSRFQLLALWLKNNDVISRDELDEYFWHGLPKDIRRSIRHDLDMHSKADFPSMKQAARSARHVIQAMIDEEEDESPFRFSVVTEFVSSSEDLAELVNVPAEIVPESDKLVLDDIVQAAGDVVLAVDKVVCAAKGVPAIDDVVRAADGFWRAVDEKTLSNEEMLRKADDVPVLASVDPPTDEDSQWIDDKDLGRREDEVTESKRLWKDRKSVV